MRILIFIFFLACSPPGPGQKTSFIKGQSFSSPFGKRKKIVLPDKTEVTLNSNTTVWLDRNFGKLNRDVQISGDALFNIKNTGNLFTIYSPHLTLTTLQAVARVNAYGDVAGEETSLLNGRMRVVKSYYSKLDHDPYLLKDGDMVMMNKDIDLMEKETFNTGDLKNWMSDTIVLKNASVNELVNRLKSWFNVEVTFTGNVSTALVYSGRFPNADLQTILYTVGKAWKFRFSTLGNAVVLQF